jgi:uncharacterized Fe-S cluster-containing radical SAM superfamily protein
MYDPVERARAAARVVCKNAERKYYRFRPARFYGGIATADCVGCCLSCAFCWAWNEVHHPEATGEFHSAQDVAARLTAIARRRGFRQVRLSGNEPTICRTHLMQVIAAVPAELTFILETNGILIGAEPSYAADLAAYRNLYVRVSLKGTNEDEFARLTGARADAFGLQLAAVENLYRAGVAVRAAAMVSFSPPGNVERLRARLARIAAELADLETEELVLYGDVERRLRAMGIAYRSAYAPRETPREQV